MTPEEEWRGIEGWEDLYGVSDLGRVRSLDRWVPNAGHKGLQLRRGRVLKQTRGPYASQVGLHRDGRMVAARVHQLVAAAFLGPRPEGLEVCHNNGDQYDNRVENLRYDTHRENIRDQVRHGTHAKSSRTACKWGHEYIPGSFDIKDGARICRPCQQRRNQRLAARRKADRATSTSPPAASATTR